MSSTNSGPAQTQTQNLQPLAGTFNADGTPAAIVGPGGVVVTRPFDPSSVAITGGVIADLLGAKLRRLAAAAAVSNPVVNRPLVVPSAWAATTTYTVGTVVSNGGSQYICYTAGTSAGSGGPAGTGAAPIIDGTAAWHYYGAVRNAATSVLAPTITYSPSTPSGLTNIYTGIANPANFLFAGGTPTPAPSNPSTQVAFPSLTGGVTGGNIGYNNGKSNLFWSVTFETDAPKYAIGTNNNNTVPVRVIVQDLEEGVGRYVTEGGDVYGAANPCWRVHDFSSVGGRRRRRITVEGFGSILFAGIRVDPQSKVWAPASNDTVKVAVLGSSIECGASGYPICAGQSWSVQAGRLLGWSDVRNLGIGGSGYTIDGSFVRYSGHLSDATSFAPDIVIVGGPINDNGTASATLQSAALSLYQQIRAALPNAIIIAGGNFPSATGPSAACLAAEGAVQAAVAQFADARTFFIPIAADSQGAWVDGTGKVTAPTGTGNADVYICSDGTHPMQNGIDYESFRWASAIRQIVLPALI